VFDLGKQDLTINKKIEVKKNTCDSDVKRSEGADEGLVVREFRTKAKIFVFRRTKKRDEIAEVEVPVLRGRVGLRQHQEGRK
jgi:hypothetical protein